MTVRTLAGGIDVPYAAQARRIRRRRRAVHQPKRWTTETVDPITDRPVPQATPAQLADAVRDHWSMENKVHWAGDGTDDADRGQLHTGTGPQLMAALRNAAISVVRRTGATNIAAATRHHARDSRPPPDPLKTG